jgi:myosin heavy subunit
MSCNAYTSQHARFAAQLFENKPGLFALLDDACAMADASAPKLLQAFNAKLGKHAHYKTSKVNDGTFTVRHYAGEVTYTTEGMIIANRDTYVRVEQLNVARHSQNGCCRLLNDLTNLMVSSTKCQPLVRRKLHRY